MKGLIINLRPPKPHVLVTMAPTRSQPEFLLSGKNSCSLSDRGPAGQHPNHAGALPSVQGDKEGEPGNLAVTDLNPAESATSLDKTEKEGIRFSYLGKNWGFINQKYLLYVSFSPHILLNTIGDKQKHHGCLFPVISGWLEMRHPLGQT